MTGTPPEMSSPLMLFARNSAMRSMSSLPTRARGPVTGGTLGATFFRSTRSVWCTEYAVRTSRSSLSRTVDDAPATGALVSEEPSNFRMQPPAARFARCGG